MDERELKTEGTDQDVRIVENGDLGREERLSVQIAERRTTFLDKITALENGAVVFQAFLDALAKCRKAALNATRPEDWLLFRAADSITATLTKSGAELVAKYYGVQFSAYPVDETGRFKPDKIHFGDGKIYEYRGWANGFTRFDGQRAENLEASVISTEQFTGRRQDKDGRITSSQDDPALEGDLRAALYSRLFTKSVRMLCGMTRVPLSELTEAWQGTSKTVEQCRKGHGYGTTSDRAAGRVTEAGVEEQRDKLWAEIQRLTGGDKAEAVQVLKRITSKPVTAKSKGFAGFDSIGRLTLDWQVESAWKALKNDPDYQAWKEFDSEPALEDRGETPVVGRLI